jgi:hypothetical protein
MAATFTVLMFTLERIRNVLLVLAMIVLLKAAWLTLAPVIPGL